MATQTNLAAQHAVIQDALPLRDLTVISIFTSPEGTRAILRSARGAISTVRTGDTLDGLTVSAIDPSGVYLTARAGDARVLTLPGF